MELNLNWQSKEGLVYVAGDSGHGYCDESLVVFTGVQGMEELNNRDPILVSINGNALNHVNLLPILNSDYRSFYVGNTENYGDHIQGTGFVKEIFLPKPIEFVRVLLF